MGNVLRVGLTGGIGSGKSAVAARLEERGAAVSDADQLARAVVAKGTDGLAEIVAAFGRRVLTATGELDRPALGAIVFTDADALQTLNGITHPRIGELTIAEFAAAKAAGVPVWVHDVPLLVENGMAENYDAVIVVEAPLETRLIRLTARGLPRDEAEKRIANQASDEDRRRVATYVIDNSGHLAALNIQVERLWRGLTVGYGSPLELPVTKAELSRVGVRLAAGTASREDETAFERTLGVYDELGSRIQVRVAAATGAPVHSRTKTRDTLLAKIPRGIKLADVQDTAGVRVVVEGGRSGQDEAVASIVAAITHGGVEPRIVDRRTKPSYGYRAVHVIGRMDGLPFEVQVRTRAQHEWAQLAEKTADVWGRQLRYGGEPDLPELTNAWGEPRSAFWWSVQHLSSLIDLVERFDADGREQLIVQARSLGERLQW